MTLWQLYCMKVVLNVCCDEVTWSRLSSWCDPPPLHCSSMQEFTPQHPHSSPSLSLWSIPLHFHGNGMHVNFKIHAQVLVYPHSEPLTSHKPRKIPPYSHYRPVFTPSCWHTPSSYPATSSGKLTIRKWFILTPHLKNELNKLLITPWSVITARTGLKEKSRGYHRVHRDGDLSRRGCFTLDAIGALQSLWRWRVKIIPACLMSRSSSWWVNCS